MTSSFAQKQLEKYGWEPGQGLGKERKGISEAMLPHYQHDTAGIGSAEGNFVNWWDDVYNKAMSKLGVIKASEHPFKERVQKEKKRRKYTKKKIKLEKPRKSTESNTKHPQSIN